MCFLALLAHSYRLLSEKGCRMQKGMLNIMLGSHFHEKFLIRQPRNPFKKG